MVAGLSGLIRELYDYGVIMIGEFQLTSGLESPYYIDLKRIYSNPMLFKKVIDEYIAILDRGSDYDAVAGVETGGIPLAAVIAYVTSKPMVYVRSAKKSFGTSRAVEGILDQGSRVVVVDDVATTGGSLAHAVRSIRSIGGDVREALVFIDRLQGASDKLSELGVKLLSVYRIDEVVSHLYRGGMIDESDFNTIMSYIGGSDDY